MSDRIIYALTGLPGVGKSAVADRLANPDPIPVVNMGEEMKKQYQSMPISGQHDDVPQGTWEMAQALRDEFGPRGPAFATTSRVSSAFVEHDRVVVDGIRHPKEVEWFENRFDCPVHLIKVTADYETRLERFYQRSDYSNKEELDGITPISIAEHDMNKRTSREAAEGLRKAIKRAQYEIDNNGSLDETEAQCARLLDILEPVEVEA